LILSLREGREEEKSNNANGQERSFHFK
jgi:hypothetical protein